MKNTHNFWGRAICALINLLLLSSVTAFAAAENYAAYLFAYFKGEGLAQGEQIYFAVSEDGLHWKDLNDGNPVLVSSLGEKGLRDPFIMRSAEGDRFFVIATDLKIYGNGNWSAAQTTGSKSIMVWESTDLVHWSEQRMCRVAPDARAVRGRLRRSMTRRADNIWSSGARRSLRAITPIVSITAPPRISKPLARRRSG